ncbi:MAG: hypothetical protein ACOCZH_01160 [Phototrophicaceae bacterium]
MIRYKRNHTLWLLALSIMTALVVVAGGVTAEVQALVMGLFTVALAGSFIDFQAITDTRFTEAIQQHSPLNRSRASVEAREALSRAATRGGQRFDDLQLTDVGLIATQSSREGMAMRRTRTISKDDDGVRPFITLHVPASEADRSATIRYEIIDQTGREQYIHEMRVYLREGEMNVLADNHLPLMNNDRIAGMGECDLRVYINGGLIGVHTFSLTASYEERRQRLHGSQHFVTESDEDEYEVNPFLDDRDERNPFVDDRDENNPFSRQGRDAPLTLEELLRKSGNRSGDQSKDVPF